MLYHSSIFMPRRISKSLPNNLRVLVYSNHAIRESKNDRYGSFKLPETIIFTDCELIEAEVYNNQIEKIVIRYNLDENRSLCMAIKPKENFVKTVWINLNSDQHNTLDRNRYVKSN